MMENKLTDAAQKELSSALYDLRRRLKEREKEKTGRTPTVCTDESIKEMVRMLPRKPSDFRGIPGVGPAFVENFAQDFLRVLADYNGNQDSASVTHGVEETLRELSKKLININRSNRMLFLPRLSSKYAVDLFDQSGKYNPLDILFDSTAPVVIADSSA